MMKSYLLAGLLALVPASANAAVVVNFTGTTYAGGSYTRNFDGANSTFVTDSGTRAVTGTITIDTAAAGANQAGAPEVYYDNAAGGSFLTVEFASTGATPVQLTGQGSFQSLDSSYGLFFNLFDEAGSYAYTFTLFGLDALPTASYGGALLPNFATGRPLSFSVTSRQGPSDGPFVEVVSQGDVAAITQVLADAPAVPEPASWAMMIAGIGVVGAAARRRRTATLAHA